MTTELDALVALLRLEALGGDRYCGASQDLGWGAVFGGQVLAQALSAASDTVDDGRLAHSLHAYFLQRGDAARPIEYFVERLRDGRSFCTRRVVGFQGTSAIFHLSCSFQVVEPGLEHQDAVPHAPGPSGLATERELAAPLAGLLPPGLADRAVADRAIEVRPVSPRNPVQPEVRPPHRQVWLRASGALPDDPGLHRLLLAWASDSHFLTTALQPHGVSWLTPGLQVASLDHALWFHRPFHMDQWLLYDIWSPSASGARGLVRGTVHDQRGRLVATVMQEGLIRDRR